MPSPAGLMSNVFIVDVDVNEAAQLILIVVKMATKLGVLRSQLIERFTAVVACNSRRDWPLQSYARR